MSTNHLSGNLAYKHKTIELVKKCCKISKIQRNGETEKSMQMKCLLHSRRSCSLYFQCIMIILRHFLLHASVHDILFFDCYTQIKAKGSVHTKGLLRFPLRVVKKF